MFRYISILVVYISIVIAPTHIQAQELVTDHVTLEKARVTRVISHSTDLIPGTDVTSIFQRLEAVILSGPEIHKTVILEDDHLNLKTGDVFYIRHTTNPLEGIDVYSVADIYRLPLIYILMGLFVLSVCIYGGKQGIRGLLSLIGSLACIIYILLPAILHGYSPILISMAVASLIIILGSYITHGFNKVTSSAVIGMTITIILTGIMAYLSIYFGRLTGFSSDEAVYLNLNTRGTLDFSGLLIGGVLIGLLGVLYDAAIGQAVSVDELRTVGPHLSRSVIFKRAIRIGREHIGALVNTLAIAYVGASLPLLLLLYNSPSPVSILINQELFATEIVRTMIGSIGLILAVPITTYISVALLVKPRVTNDEQLKKTEEHSLQHHGHTHSTH